MQNDGGKNSQGTVRESLSLTLRNTKCVLCTEGFYSHIRRPRLDEQSEEEVTFTSALKKHCFILTLSHCHSWKLTKLLKDFEYRSRKRSGGLKH